MFANSRGGAAVTLLVVLVVVALAAGGAYYFSRPTATVAIVKPDLAVQSVPGSVTVLAEPQELKTELGGRVIESKLDAGLAVHAGDVLVQIDPGDLDLEIERLESELRALKARIAVGSSLTLQLETAKEVLANLERTLKLGTASEAQVIQQRRNVQTGEQSVALEAVANTLQTELAENNLKVKRRQRDKMTLRAPMDGVVSTVIAGKKGDLINNNVPIATLISANRTVEAKISEENFVGLQIGQHASVRFLGYGEQLYGASVIKILPTAEPQTQRYIVHLNVDLPPEKLTPGLTGEVAIETGQHQAETVVPRRALRGKQLLVVSGGRIQVRTVTLGYVALNLVEILSGVKAGEMVVVDDLDLFQPGDRVRPQVEP